MFIWNRGRFKWNSVHSTRENVVRPHRSTLGRYPHGRPLGERRRRPRRHLDVALHRPRIGQPPSFGPSTINDEPIKEGQRYHGLRLHVTAVLGSARAPFQIDIGFGDAITPAPTQTIYPALSVCRPHPCSPTRTRPWSPRSTRQWSPSVSRTAG